MSPTNATKKKKRPKQDDLIERDTEEGSFLDQLDDIWLIGVRRGLMRNDRYFLGVRRTIVQPLSTSTGTIVTNGVSI